MSETGALLESLKKCLKQNQYTYADVAAHLELSEASVKRMFSEKNISLQRLESICQWLEIDIAGLVHEMQAQYHQPISQLTLEQEKEIADDLFLLMITVNVLNRWSMDELIRHHKLSPARCIRYLAHLDRLRIIELQPGNRIKLLVAPNFKWQDDGPIMRVFRARIESEYFRTRFNREGEQLVVLNGMLSQAGSDLFQRKLKQLARDFDSLNQADSRLPLNQRSGFTVLLAIRAWDYGQLFDLSGRPAEPADSLKTSGPASA